MNFKRKKHEQVDRGEASLEAIETIGLTQSQIVRKRFFQHKAAVISIFVLLAIYLLV